MSVSEMILLGQSARPEMSAQLSKGQSATVTCHCWVSTTFLGQPFGPEAVLEWETRAWIF